MYKVIKDGEIVDAIRRLQFVRKNHRNGKILSCNSKKGEGVLSDDGSVIYQLAGRDSMGDDYDVVELVEIDEAEFKRLRDLLDGVEVEDPETDEGEHDESSENPEVPEDPKPPMSVAEMRRKIVELEEQYAELKEMLEAICASGDNHPHGRK